MAEAGRCRLLGNALRFTSDRCIISPSAPCKLDARCLDRTCIGNAYRQVSRRLSALQPLICAGRQPARSQPFHRTLSRTYIRSHHTLVNSRTTEMINTPGKNALVKNRPSSLWSNILPYILLTRIQKFPVGSNLMFWPCGM